MVQETDHGATPDGEDMDGDVIGDDVMDNGDLGPDAVPDEPRTAGERLHAAREAQGLTLAQVSAKTRIPERHLQTVEAGEFSQLPGRTYAVGFARTYAKTVDLDQQEIVELVRQEMGVEETGRVAEIREGKLEPGDPTRVPSRGLALLSVLALALLVSGGFLFYRTYFVAGSGPGSLLTAEQQREAAAAALEERMAARGEGAGTAAGPTGGAVVFTALEEDTWVKFYDANGDQLMQKEMAKGERYTVPADAEGPQVWTGRPFALAITVGGQSVPKLSEVDEIVKDVPVTAEALLARAQSGVAGEASATGQ